jgi:hypothetical protein
MPVCGAGPVFWAKAEPHRSVRAVTVISFFIDLSFGDLPIIRRAKWGSWIGGCGASLLRLKGQHAECRKRGEKEESMASMPSSETSKGTE